MFVVHESLELVNVTPSRGEATNENVVCNVADIYPVPLVGPGWMFWQLSKYWEEWGGQKTGVKICRACKLALSLCMYAVTVLTALLMSMGVQCTDEFNPEEALD